MSKQVIFCNPIQWIAEAESRLSGGKTPLADVIDKTCSHKSLERKNYGITLLFPLDQAYREDLLKRIESGKQEDYESVQLELLTLIMPEAVISPSELTTPERTKKPSPDESGPLGNWLGEVYTFEKSGNEFILKIDDKAYATITNEPPKQIKDIQTHYVPKNPLLKAQSKYSVWFISFKSGVSKLPIDKNMTQKYQRKGASRTGHTNSKSAVTGGCEYINPTDINKVDKRFLLAKQLEAEFAKQMHKDACKSYHPYLPVVTSLLNYLSVIEPEIYNNVLSVVDYDPLITFYLLLEPYKQTGALLIPQEKLYTDNTSWNQFCLTKNPKKEYLEHINNKNKIGGLIFTDPETVLSVINGVRGTILANKTYSSLSAAVRAEYVKFLNSPNEVFNHSFSQEEIARRIWQDEFRFHISSALKCTISRGKFDFHEYEILLNHIEFGWSGNNHADELVACCTNTQSKILTAAEFGLLQGFICSSDFMYFPVRSQNIGAPTEARSYDVDEAKTIVNRNYSANRALEQLHETGCNLETAVENAQKVLKTL